MKNENAKSKQKQNIEESLRREYGPGGKSTFRQQTGLIQGLLSSYGPPGSETVGLIPEEKKGEEKERVEAKQKLEEDEEEGKKLNKEKAPNLDDSSEREGESGEQESQQEKKEGSNGDTPKENIDNFGVFNDVFGFHSDVQYLTIIGSIEGHSVLSPQDKTTKYENLIPQLVAVEENKDIKGMLVILNTMGGDVEAGLAIAELIATMSKPVVSLVLGGGHSIGVPLATAADYSFIAESATMTLHPIRLTGMVIGAEPTFDYFRKMQDRVVDFIVRTSGASRAKIEELMNATDNLSNDIGTLLFGSEAVEVGLIDEVGGLDRALRKLREMVV